MSLNQERLNEFLGRAVVDIGATLHAETPPTPGDYASASGRSPRK